MKKVACKVKDESINPHAWMTGCSGIKAAPKKESIRQWYTRTTGWAMKTIIFITLCSFTTIGIMWCTASLPVLQRLQTANGALTIPLIGGVWIFGFIFMFLVPSREASFRGQESLEEAVEIVQEAVREQIAPAAVIWGRLGEHLEREMPSMIQKVNETLDDLRKAAKNIEAAAERNGNFVDEAKPAIEALRRIENNVESEIKGGFFENIKAAADGVKMMAGVPKDATQPDDNWALLGSLRKSRSKTSADGKPVV